MAKKKEPDIQARILTKSIPQVEFEVDGGGVVTLDNKASGWKLVLCPGISAPTHAGVWSGYIDLAGMTVSQELSLAVQAVDIQESDAVLSSGTDLFFVWDIVSDVPIDWVSELAIGIPGVRSPFPGQLGSTRNMENIIQGRFRVFASNSTILTSMVVVQEGKWGVNAATASDRLYIYRVVHGGNVAGLPSQTAIPPATFAMPVIFFEEESLSHMERLRRSYILQGPFS